MAKRINVQDINPWWLKERIIILMLKFISCQQQGCLLNWNHATIYNTNQPYRDIIFDFFSVYLLPSKE